MIQQKAFSNIHKGYLDNSISKGSSILDEAPKKPDVSWETFQPSSITVEVSPPPSVSSSNSSNSIMNQNFFQQPTQTQPVEPQSPTLPPGWEAATTEEGYTYYYNTSTGESKWELPT